LPKRLPVPDVANHLVCSVCGARNGDLNHPIHAAGYESSRGDRQISAMVIRLDTQRGGRCPLKLEPGSWLAVPGQT
jgi:hypothetical protein